MVIAWVSAIVHRVVGGYKVVFGVFLGSSLGKAWLVQDDSWVGFDGGTMASGVASAIVAAATPYATAVESNSFLPEARGATNSGGHISW